MTISEIKRVQFKATALEDVPDSQLICLPDIREQAQQELGYEPTQPRAESPEGEKPLRDALRKLEMEVLDHRSVLTYMWEMMFKEQQKYLQELLADSPTKAASLRWFDKIEWVEEDLKEYHRFVPDFVLEKALQIRKQLPDVQFGVVSLTRSSDPFLIAYLGGKYSWDRSEGYYIEVWDEAAFERSQS